MIDVLMMAPACASEPTGMYARVNDILRYHRTEGYQDIHIDVAAISWDGNITPTWDNEQIFPPSGDRIRRVLQMLATSITQRDADIVHLTNFLPYVRWILPLLAHDKPLVVGPNNTGNLFPPSLLSEKTLDIIKSENGPFLRRWQIYGETLERLYIHSLSEYFARQTTFFAQSNYARRILRERGAKKESITVLPSGVPTDVFNPNGSSADWPAHEGDLRLLFVGKPTRRKGVHILADAIAEVTDNDETRSPSVVVLGSDQPPEFLDNHRGLGRMTFQGRIDRKHLARFYRAADAFVTPSYYEAEPTVMIEALACGTPVIATDSEPFTEIGTETTCKYFQRGSSSQLANSIVEFEMDKEIYATNARTRAGEYDIAQTYERLARMYRALT